MQLGFGLWRRLYVELEGLVGPLFGCSELVSASGSMSRYVSVTSHNSSVWGKNSREHLPCVQLVVCSTLLRLINCSVLEFRVNWVTLHGHFRRQKLAFHIHTPTLWHTNHRVWGSLRGQVSIPVAWFVYQLWIGGVWTDASVCNESLASCWCQFCVPFNCY